jgi:hypothetical protein
MQFQAAGGNPWPAVGFAPVLERADEARMGGRGILSAMLLAASAVVAAAPAPAQGQAAATAAAVPPPEARAEPTPQREFQDAAGRLCRAYERTVTIDGRKQQAVAVVCREANGRWVMSR